MFHGLKRKVGAVDNFVVENIVVVVVENIVVVVENIVVVVVESIVVVEKLVAVFVVDNDVDGDVVVAEIF